MLAFLGSIGPWEVILIIVVALLVFGAKKLPELGRAVGKGIKEFKRGINDVESEINAIDGDPKDPYRHLEQNNGKLHYEEKTSDKSAKQ